MGPVKKIFVGGIAHGTTEEDIKTHFMQFGTVSLFFEACCHKCGSVLNVLGCSIRSICE